MDAREVKGQVRVRVVGSGARSSWLAVARFGASRRRHTARAVPTRKEPRKPLHVNTYATAVARAGVLQPLCISMPDSLRPASGRSCQRASPATRSDPTWLRCRRRHGAAALRGSGHETGPRSTRAGRPPGSPAHPAAISRARAAASRSDPRLGHAKSRPAPGAGASWSRRSARCRPGAVSPGRPACRRPRALRRCRTAPLRRP